MCEVYDELVKTIRKSFYTCPLAKKPQRVFRRAERAGKVKKFTKAEIQAYIIERKKKGLL